MIHVSSGDDLDHVLKNYLQDVEGRVEVTTAHASDDFHVSNANNIDFGLVQEMDVKANQIVSSSSPPVSTIHDLGYVLAEHGDYVSEMNMGIEQDPTPLMPSKPHQVGISLPEETI